MLREVFVVYTPRYEDILNEHRVSTSVKIYYPTNSPEYSIFVFESVTKFVYSLCVNYLINVEVLTTDLDPRYSDFNP